MKFPITPYKVKKAFLYWKHFGTREFLNHLADRLEPSDVPYGPWFENHRIKEADLEKQRKTKIANGPVISVIVPAFHTPEQFLRELIDSMRAQSYPDWELCIADAGASSESYSRHKPVESVVMEYAKDDNRIKYEKLEDNYGISENTNRGMAMAKGDYIALLDHDDLIEPDALYELAKAAAAGADMIYTDEDKVTSDLSKYFQPHFKPDFNLDLLRSNNYITHFLCVKKSLAEEAGGFRDEMNGAQDYDFVFRVSEKAEKIAHVPRVLYHWRTHEASTADNPMSKQYAYDAGKRAIEGNLERTRTKGEVEVLPDFGFYRVHYPVQGNPLISIIIPNKDESDTLKSCLDALFESEYDNFEVIIIENGSIERKTFEYYKSISTNEKIRLVRWMKGFNYSAINNYGARFARGNYLLLLNNDVRGSISKTWLAEMLGVCQRPEVGAVGAKLYYPDNKIQHAGIVVGIGGVAGSMFVDLPRGRSGYLHKASILQDMSAVTAACMLVKRDVYEAVGGLTEELAVAFNDVDLCLKIREAGHLVVYDPYAELYHDESKSRGAEDTPEKVKRFQNEIEYMRTRWESIIKNGDPMYNPNLSLKKWDYSLKA